MRQLTDHIVEGDAANHQLMVDAVDEPGAGGACHRYAIRTPSSGWMIDFQNGPIKENGVNGVTNEALLAILIDRLRGFQGQFRPTQFACRENAIALTHCEDALSWLQKRTRERIKRGVEGTMAK